MLPAVVALADDLRNAGVSVSTSELLDATAALDSIDIGDKVVFRTALQSTLIKNERDLTTFDNLFFDRFLSEIEANDDHAGAMTPEDLRDLILQGLDGDDEALSQAAREAVVQFRGLLPGRFLGMDYHVRRVAKQFSAGGALSVARAGSEDPVDVLRDAARSHRLEAELADQVRQHAVRVQGTDWDRRNTRANLVEHMDFLRLTPEQVIQVRRAAQALGRKLASRLRRQNQKGRVGRLRLGPTVRNSLMTGGVPFEPVFGRRQPHRPELLILADVSGSVATFSRFTLQLVHALAAQYGQVRTFVFVDEIDEVTKWFRRSNDFETEMADVDSHAVTMGEEGHSDYGRVLDSFAARWMTQIKSSTSVIILGDARNNYHPVRAGVLANIAARAKNVYWLNPEPKTYWDSADSVMSTYTRNCTQVFECRNLDQLTAAITSMN